MRRLLGTAGAAWVALAGLLCGCSMAVTALAAAAPAWARTFDWQPSLGLHEPWRLWTCAWVHWSPAHLGVNAVGAVVVAAVGWRARLPRTAAGAWFVAWPLTAVWMAALGGASLGQVLSHYGGLSGVLHAGAIVLGLALAWPRTGAGRAPQPALQRIADDAARSARERWIGAAIVAGTVVKVLFEAPWDLAPRPSAALAIAVAPIAHACGVAAGLAAWSAVRMVSRRQH